MKPILILQNCEDELAGTVFDFLTESSIDYRTSKTFADDAIPDLSEIGPIICLGCPVSLTDYRQHEYLKSLYAFVSSAIRERHPYLGICFGGQLLAKILGADVGPNAVREIGLYKVHLTEAGAADPLFDRFPSVFPVFHWHGDRFRIPFGAQLLAEGDDCKYQAFRSGNFAAVQFHLEPTVPEVSHWCDVYASELTDVGKNKNAIVREFKSVASQLKELNYLLLENFLKLSKENARP